MELFATFKHLTSSLMKCVKMVKPESGMFWIHTPVSRKRLFQFLYCFSWQNVILIRVFFSFLIFPSLLNENSKKFNTYNANETRRKDFFVEWQQQPAQVSLLEQWRAHEFLKFFFDLTKFFFIKVLINISLKCCNIVFWQILLQILKISSFVF